MNNRLLIAVRAFLIVLLITVPAISFAQDTLVVVFGTVKDLTNGMPLTEFTVTATEQKTVTQVPSRVQDNGRYEIDIVQEGDYMVEFNAPGHVPKRVQLELRGPSPEQWKGGYGMNVDITLFREVEGLDLTLASKPFGICRYDKVNDIFTWDLAYTEAQRDRIAELLKEYEQRVPSAR